MVNITIRRLIQTLCDPAAWCWKERVRAAHRLGTVRYDTEEKEEVTYALIDVVENQVPGDTRDERERGCYRWLFLSPFVLALICLLAGAAIQLLTGLPAASVDHHSHENSGESWWSAVGALLTVGVILLPPLIRAALIDWEDYRINRVRLAAVEALGKLCAPEAVGALAGELFRQNARLRHTAESALLETLPGLTPEHYGALPTNAVPNLCGALAHSNETLVVRVLEGLEKVGDRRALPPVARLAAQRRSAAVHDAAARLLPILEERKRQETDRRVLLRGAARPPEEELLLVRPMSGTDPPEMLLRALGPDPHGN
jgi:HEAT repeat protein